MKVETAATAASCAGRETTSEQSFDRCREGTALLMPRVDPIDLAAVDGVGDTVQRVADDSITRLHAGRLRRFDQKISYSFAHSGTSCVAWHVRELTSRDADLRCRLSSMPRYLHHVGVEIGDDPE